MQIFNPAGMDVRVFRRAAGAESMQTTAFTQRLTLDDLPVVLPSSPARFQFPPPNGQKFEETQRSEDERIAAIVARTLQQLETKKAETAVPVLTITEFMETAVLPSITRKIERDTRRLAVRRLTERVGFCAKCRTSWRLDGTAIDSCSRCGDARILNPGIDLVDSAALKCLAGSLLDDDGNPATAKKYLTYLMTVLNAAHDRGLIRKVKKPQVPQSETLIRVLSESELLNLYKSAESAVWPRHDQFSAPDFWRAFLVTATVYGMRLGELCSLPWTETAGSRRLSRGFHAASECPRPELRHFNLISETGWLVYLPAKQANAKPLPLVLPVRDVVSEHLERIRGERRFVFDVYSGIRTRAGGDYRDVKISLYRQWNALCESAGIAERATPHDLRRTQETLYDNQFGKGFGGEVNGHAARTVSDQYYSQAVPRIFRAVRELRLPPFSK